MEKVTRKSRLFLGFVTVLTFVVPVATGTARRAVAGTVLMGAPPLRYPNVRRTDEEYPESRFGQPPVRVKTGTEAGYASRAVEAMEEGDDENPSRKPAGLIFNDAQASTHGSAQASADASATTTGSPSVSSTTPSSMTVGEPERAVPRKGLEAEPEPIGATRRKGVQEVAVIAGDLGFFPKTVFVVRDIPVRLFVTGASKNTLCIMMDSFQVRKQIRSQRIEEISFTPSTPGRYRFYCPVNGMEGTMIVKELISG